jgi:3-oxoacyl-[acyl-carrier-protein] synthase-1
LLIASIEDALENAAIELSDNRTILIISTTKGNISLLETNQLTDELSLRIALHTSAKYLGDYFQCTNQPIVVSNACISGSLAIFVGEATDQFR